MGKRMAVAEPKHSTPATRTIRKRKRNSSGAIAVGAEMIEATAKALRESDNNYWHENDDEDSSSNDTTIHVTPRIVRNQSTKQANNSSILLSANTSVNESPKPVYTLLPSVVNGTIMYDLMQKPWRLGKPIGKGNFGEIFLASDNITIPVTNENAKFVVKIEPHSNGPLFVEIHCLMNTAKSDTNNIKMENDKMDDRQHDIAASLQQTPPSGIPNYIASGSHYFGDARYRFLVLQRFDRDLHSIIKNRRVHQKSVLTLAIQIVNVLEKLHDKGYCHNDVKAQNLMISKCKYYKKQTATAPVTTGKSSLSKNTSNLKPPKYDDEHYEEKQQTTDSGNSSEQEANDDDDDDDGDSDFVVKRNTYADEDDDEDEDEDFDDGATTNSNTNSVDIYETPVNRNRKRRQRGAVEFSGSNPVGVWYLGLNFGEIQTRDCICNFRQNCFPVRSCRRQKRNSIYEEMVKSHYLRPAKRVSYSEFFNEDGASVKGETADSKSASSDEDSDEFLPSSARRSATVKKSATNSNSYTCAATNNSTTKRLTRRQEKLFNNNKNKNTNKCAQNGKNSVTTNGGASAATAIAESLVAIEQEHIFLIDYGLASKFMDNGIHRPFVMDQRRAHDGTLEFTSRDAHMGAHSRRSDLECLGYNLIFWSQGYLPWKDAATQHQQEKVHQAKEILMTDVREMLKQIYGKEVPKYLGEFLHLVGQLAYHERPNYSRYRRLFEREFQQLGYSLTELQLDSNEIERTCVRVKEEIENKNDLFEMNRNNGNAGWSIMKNLSVGTPFHERTLSNRVSPKNLRSKSDKKSMKRKKFSWAEVLSQDPDQIARERAEKEFDREEELSEVQQPVVRRYEGNPTYAILEIQQRLKMNGRLGQQNDEQQSDKNDMDVEEEGEEDEECEEENMEVDDNSSEEDVEGETEDNEEEESDEENGDDDEDEKENGNGHDDDDEDVETDATEVTIEPELNGGRKTRAHNTRSTRAKLLSAKSPEKKRNIRSNGKQRSTNSTKSAVKTTTATNVPKSKSSSTIISSKSAKTDKRSKRTSTSTTRSRGRRGCSNDTNTNSSSSINNGGGRSERRTRRCLIKTDTEMMDDLVEQESNSNFSPDVCGLFNVWKKINNENIYYRGRNAAAASANRHCKK